jgi:hypothetical protein
MHEYLRHADTWLRSCFEISMFLADSPADSPQAPGNTHRLTGHYGTITASSLRQLQRVELSGFLGAWAPGTGQLPNTVSVMKSTEDSSPTKIQV